MHPSTGREIMVEWWQVKPSTDLVGMASQKSWDFLDASKRHYDDAVLLQANACLPNAAQLFGLSAECGVKALSEKIQNQPLPSNYYKHANVLVNLLPKLFHGRLGATYLARIGLFKSFSSWDIEDRYRSVAQIPLAKHMADWVAASKEVQDMLTQAYIDGVLP